MSTTYSDIDPTRAIRLLRYLIEHPDGCVRYRGRTLPVAFVANWTVVTVARLARAGWLELEEEP